MPIADIRELGTIVSVWAHPDDEAYLCGGLMSLAAAAGSRVVCVTATRGELGVTDPVRWPPERLADIREAELAECLRRLGLTEHHWLGYPDGGCASVEQAEAAGRIAAILQAVRPDTVLTFAVDGQTGHPDHIAVHHWTREAVRQSGIGTLHVVANPPEWVDRYLPKLVELGALMGEPPQPWRGPLSVDLSLDPQTVERKLSALAAQASQTEAMRALAGEEYYRGLVAVERFRVLAAEVVTA